MQGESIMEICGVDRDDFLPSETTFYKRLSLDPEFAQEYARARVAQGHREADEIRTIADNATNEDVQIARLRIDARKWRASKMAPKVYGEKTAHEFSGPDGGPIQTVDMSKLSTEALAEIVAASDGQSDAG